MTSQDLVARLVDDVEESLEAMGHVGLYEFTWSLRGYGLGLDGPEMHRICLKAYQILTHKHDVALQLSRWPLDGDWWDADPDVALDFDLDPDASLAEPLLLLVRQNEEKS